ncbi:MAG TPA: hypothetical protein PKC30_12140 [Saprospiraceae bacterium]|nr:hypothetical protein [Saprospiraceae bacterium]
MKNNPLSLQFSILLLSILFIFYTGCSDGLSDQNGSVFSGSYSTMLTINNRLYLVNSQEIITYNIETKQQPEIIDKKNVGFDIESLFHYDGLLLIGSSRAMHIFKIDANGIPVRESTTDYFDPVDAVCAGDPIVMRNQLAYVTLADVVDNSNCWGRFVNELRIYKMEDLARPELLNIIPMPNPKGLGIGQNNLYICDGRAGLFIYDISDPVHPEFKFHFSGFEAFDVIVLDHLLVVSAKNKLLQFDIRDENAITMVGQIDL